MANIFVNPFAVGNNMIPIGITFKLLNLAIEFSHSIYNIDERDITEEQFEIIGKILKDNSKRRCSYENYLKKIIKIYLSAVEIDVKKVVDDLQRKEVDERILLGVYSYLVSDILEKLVDAYLELLRNNVKKTICIKLSDYYSLYAGDCDYSRKMFIRDIKLWLYVEYLEDIFSVRNEKDNIIIELR